MPRYIKQRDKFSCGPVVILNALKWAGADATYDDHIGYLTDLAVCWPPEGTCHAPFDRALRVAGKGFYSARRVYYPTLGEMEAHLRDEGAIAFNYEWQTKKDGRHRHFELLVGMSASGQSIYMVNGYRKGAALRRMTRKRFKKVELRFQRVDPHYKAWFLKKAV